MTKATFTVNPKGCQDYVKTSPEVADGLLKIAMAVQTMTKANILVRRNRMHFPDSIKVQKPGPSADGTTQMASVYSESPLFHIIEFGSINNPAYRPMSRAGASIRGAKWTQT